MELRHIKYFLAVAKESNFTRAAEKLGIGQPPLSQQIRSLEQEMDVLLFRRLPHGAELTDAGMAFLPEAKAVLAQAEKAVLLAKRADKGELGHLKLGFTSSAIFTPSVQGTLHAFHKRYPQITLSFAEQETVVLLQQLMDQNLDAAFIRPGRNDPEGFKTYRLGEERTYIALSSENPLAKQKALSLKALANEPLILFPRKAGPALFDEIIASFVEAGVTPTIACEAPQISTVGNLVAAGLGYSIVPESIAKQTSIHGVTYLEISGKAPSVPIALAVRMEEKSPLVQNFVQVAMTVNAANA